jgi:hypothetical protein
MVESIEPDSDGYTEEKCIAPYSVFTTRKDSLKDAWYTHDTSESARHNKCCYADEHTTDEGMKIERIHKV